jgi:hypothetical protein
MDAAMWRVILLSVLSIAGCGNVHHDLRGFWEESRDGRTYLSIDDNNGGHCGPLLVDGRAWAHAIGQPGTVAPGRRVISRGGDLMLEIQAGTTFHMNCWGP